MRSKYTYLGDNLDCQSGLISKLFELNVLTFEEKQEISSINISFKQSEKLIDALITKSSEKFYLFLEALSFTGQDHIVNDLKSIEDCSLTRPSSENSIQLPEKITIRSNPNDEPQIIDELKLLNQKVVLGISYLNEKIYILCFKNDLIFCYRFADGFERLQSDDIALPISCQIAHFYDMVASQKNNCLLISDNGSKCIWIIQVPDNIVEHYYLKNEEPYRLVFDDDDLDNFGKLYVVVVRNKMYYIDVFRILLPLKNNLEKLYSLPLDLKEHFRLSNLIRIRPANSILSSMVNVNSSVELSNFNGDNVSLILCYGEENIDHKERTWWKLRHIFYKVEQLQFPKYDHIFQSTNHRLSLYRQREIKGLSSESMGVNFEWTPRYFILDNENNIYMQLRFKNSIYKFNLDFINHNSIKTSTTQISFSENLSASSIWNLISSETDSRPSTNSTCSSFDVLSLTSASPIVPSSSFEIVLNSDKASSISSNSSDKSIHKLEFKVNSFSCFPTAPHQVNKMEKPSRLCFINKEKILLVGQGEYKKFESSVLAFKL